MFSTDDRFLRGQLRITVAGYHNSSLIGLADNKYIRQLEEQDDINAFLSLDKYSLISELSLLAYNATSDLKAFNRFNRIGDQNNIVQGELHIVHHPAYQVTVILVRT